MIITVAILDDNRHKIDEIKTILSSIPKLEMATFHTNGVLLLDDLRKQRVDLIIMGTGLSVFNELQFSKVLKRDFRRVKVVAVCQEGDGEIIQKFIEETNVSGFIMRPVNRQQLINAIDAVTDDDNYISQEVINELHLHRKSRQADAKKNMSKQEIEIIKCLIQQMDSKEISEKLLISERTVENYRKQIFRKAGVHSPSGLKEFVSQQKIL